MALSNAERQARWRARHANDERERYDGTCFECAMGDAHDCVPARVLVGGAYLSKRTSFGRFVGVVHTCADHGTCVFIDARGTVAPIVPTHARNDAYADGEGTCHGSAHADGEAHECTHGGHVAERVGVYTPRDRMRVNDDDAERALKWKRERDEHTADCSDCKRARMGVTSSNTYRDDSARTLRGPIRPWTRERDALLWAREYTGIIA